MEDRFENIFDRAPDYTQPWPEVFLADRLTKTEAPPEMTPQELEENLKQFIGTEHYYKPGGLAQCAGILLSDGAHYLAENAHAYWLLDIIAMAQDEPQLRTQLFQFWEIKKTGSISAIVTADDGNGNKLYEFEIGLTDFPLKSARLWMQSQKDPSSQRYQRVVHLPSEY